MTKQREKEAEEVKQYIDKLIEFEEISEEALKDAEKYKQLIVCAQKKIKAYKGVLDTALVKFSNLKQQVISLAKINEELGFENHKLSLRAGIGFQGLTPRPDYRKMMNDKKIELDIYNENNTVQKTTTIRIVDELLNRISKGGVSKVEVVEEENNFESGKGLNSAVEDNENSNAEDKNISLKIQSVLAVETLEQNNTINSSFSSSKEKLKRTASFGTPINLKAIPDLTNPNQGSKQKSIATSNNGSKRSSFARSKTEIKTSMEPEKELISIHDEWDSYVKTEHQANKTLDRYNLKSEATLKIDTFKEITPKSNLGKESLAEVNEAINLIIQTKNNG